MSCPEYLPANSTAAADQLRAISTDLERHERVIERGLESFIDIGRALSAIRDERLYRQAYASFEVYCHNRWNLSRSRAYRLIEASTVVDGMEAAIDMAVSPIGDTPALPANEGQARELSGLSSAEAVDVMSKVNEVTDGKPTAASIKAEVGKRQQHKEPVFAPDDEEVVPGMTAGQLDELNVPPNPQPVPEPEPATPAKPKRRPLEEQFFDATHKLTSVCTTLQNLGDDDRLPRNREQVARYRNDLLRAIDTLHRVADQMS